MKIVIMGEPKGKARPRFSRSGRNVHTYTPESTTDYESLVALMYRAAGGKCHDEGYVHINIKAFFQMPKKSSKKRVEDMRSGIILPAKKPDIDNIVKIIMDGLNGVAYRDDAQVVSVMASKVYSDIPRVEVEIISEEAA